MADSPTYEDLFDTGRNEVVRLPTRFAPEIVDADGSDVQTAVAISASMGDEVAGFLTASFAETFLSTAVQVGGEVLERWVWDRYQLTRQDQQAAVVPVTFTRTNPTGALSIPAETQIGTEDGITFATVTELVFPSDTNTGPLTVTATATLAGAGGNVEDGAINAVLSSLTETGVVVTNAEPAVGGQPEETNSALGARARAFFVNARRGTAAAIFNGCVTTPGVAEANVIEDLDPNGSPFFRVQAIISDQNGQANSALASNVADNLQNFRALGVPVTVVPGTPEFVTIVIEDISFQATSNTNQLIDEMRGLIVAAVNQLAPGATLERSTIITAMKFSPLVTVPDTALVSPAGDLVPRASGVLRTTSSLVSINGLVGSVT
jgi:Baseplate J-like protein